MDIIVISLITLGLIGSFAAIILFLAAKKFYVFEDPRIDEVEAILPAANCGGCGMPGCRAFAVSCVEAPELDKLFCPVGGTDVMGKVADILGKTAAAAVPTVAVVRCNGDCDNRPRINIFDGVRSCAIASNLYTGETGCSYGCHGFGDCEASCNFDAIHINPDTMLPEVIEDKCTSCGACVKACPKTLIELRRKGPKSRRVYVQCRNQEKGGIARKNCAVACIGCQKCFKVCPFEAITMEKNLAFIDSEKCKLCRKCVDGCPTNAIVALNFPIKVPKPQVEEKKEEELTVS